MFLSPVGILPLSRRAEELGWFSACGPWQEGRGSTAASGSNCPVTEQIKSTDGLPGLVNISDTVKAFWANRLRRSRGGEGHGKSCCAAAQLESSRPTPPLVQSRGISPQLCWKLTQHPQSPGPSPRLPALPPRAPTSAAPAWWGQRTPSSLPLTPPGPRVSDSSDFNMIVTSIHSRSRETSGIEKEEAGRRVHCLPLTQQQCVS